MRILRRLAVSLLVVVLVAIVAVTALVASITGRALPQVSGTLAVAGLERPVRVTRDEAGIVQIFAETPHDLFLSQGYVHAQERLWQMEFWRHISSGRLAELFGQDQLKTDKFIRTLGWRESAQRDLEELPPDVREALGAYADGVNAYLEHYRGSLGLPFVVIGLKTGEGGLGGYQPEPWTPLDSAAWQKVQAWNLGDNWKAELFRMLADAKLGDPARTDELFPAYPTDAPVIVATGAQGSSGAGASAKAPSPTSLTAAADLDTESAPYPALGEELDAWRELAATGQEILRLAGLDAGDGLAGDHGIGSNNWVVAPSKSATGHALLANDPHLGVSMPSVWFMNGLHCVTVSDACPYDVVGVSFPGVPAVVLGHNARIAWGATNAGPDVQDLYIEQVDPADETHYISRGESLPFAVRTERMKVAGGGEETIQVRSTGNGPILNDVEPRLKGAPPVALRWTATAEPDGTIGAIFRLNTARTFDDFRAALALYGSPSQNFVYADVDGHIGYQMPGYIPVRQPGHRGDRPVPGWDGMHEWEDPIPYQELPGLLDPPSGMIVTANNAAVDPRYPYFIAQDWDPGYRARRALDLLTEGASNGGITVDQMRRIQTDTKVLRAPLVVSKLDLAEPSTADGRTLVERIRAWDGECEIESRGCAAYMAFEYRVLRDVFDDDLGELVRDWIGTPVSWQTLIGLLDRPNDLWWDDGRTIDRTEAAADVLSSALDDAGRALRAELGSSRNWTWGRLHRATFREPTLGESGIGFLEWYFDHGPFSAPGASGALNNTYYRFSKAYPDPFEPDEAPASALREIFEVTNLPSYRLVIDMSDLDGAHLVQTTGNSGNPFDRHYGDLTDDWLEGKLVPLPFSRVLVERGAVSTLTLTPLQ